MKEERTMNISFPQSEAWDSNTDCVSFPAEIDGKRIRCFVSWEALQDNFGGNSIQPMDAFRASRALIEEKARKLISRSRFEKNGSIVIRSADGA